MKIRTILVSQPAPSSEKSPYFDLAKKNNVKIDFRPFIHIEGISSKEFRQQKISILDHTAIIFTSRIAADHFFRIAKDLRLAIPDEMKYFCVSESIAVYLQKYIVYRKRKIFFAKNSIDDLLTVTLKHKEERFLLPISEQHSSTTLKKLDKKKLKYTKAVFYRTVSSDLSDLAEINYDILVFFSPTGIKSLFSNFPDFKQNDTKIASFGTSTTKAVKEAGLKIDIQVPMPKAPSMTLALDNYIQKHNKEKKKAN